MNQYAYVGGSPTEYIDPTGLVLETGVDLASLGMSVNDFRQCQSIANAIFVVVDGIFFVTPVVPSPTALRHLGMVSDGAGTTNRTAGSIRNVNPTGGTRNCVNCAIATDSTLAGRPSSAMPATSDRTGINVLENFYGSKFSAAVSKKTIEQTLLNAGDGARGIVFGSRGGVPDHVFNVVNQGGVIRFLDGQSGKPSVFGGYQSLHLLKTN